MPWTNADGLIVYMAGELRSYDGGEYPSAGSIRVIEWEIPAASLTTTQSQTFGAPWVIVPRNSVIDSVELVSETAFVGAGSAVNIGLARISTTTEYDYDGLAAAIPAAQFAANGKKTLITQGTTTPNTAGVLVGQETAFPAYLTASVAGAQFTGGRLLVRLRIYVKDEDLTPTNI